MNKLTLATGIGCLLASCGVSEKKTDSVKPNVLVILADDAGYADFGFHGSKEMKTPNIDKLANGGVIFTDGHVSATVCGPSRAGLLTGRYQQRFGYENNLPPEHLGMDASEKTIADAFKSEGYRTSIFGKWHLGCDEKYHPNSRGFDEFWGFLGGSRSYFPNPKDDNPESERSMRHNKKHITYEGYLTTLLGDKTCEFIKQKSDKPFFTFLSFNAVHSPMHATKKDLDMFKGHPRQTLAAMTWSMDKAVGKVIKTLESTGKIDNTIIFFLSDNGGALSNNSYNKPLKGWKGNKFEGGHRVPFFVYWKGKLKGGVKYNKTVSALDIFPTAFAVTGNEYKAGKPLDGVNLLPYINGQKEGKPHDILFWRKDTPTAVRMGDWKMIRMEGFGKVLYNLKDDFQENNNVINQNPEIANEMTQKLEKWEKELDNAWWKESKKWCRVTDHIHHYLMQNREPVATDPSKLKLIKN